MDAGDITDPSDWHQTALAGLYPLDSSLRCLICKDFYTAPVITTCLHTFCSLCIRRSLSAEAACPACRTTNISDNGLRQNKVVGDLVENFLAVRPRLLEMAKNRPTAPAPPRQKERIPDDKPRVTAEPVRRTQLSKPEIICPICGKPFKTAEQVDLHIDTCTGQPSPSSSQSYNLRPQRTSIPPPSVNGPTNSTRNPASNPPSANPLPKVNYAMYNDTKLRALLFDLGLSTWGNRAILSARHKEFVNLHNANIDRQRPQSRRELLRQLEKWDATQQTMIRGEKRKDLDGDEWGKKCKDDFAELARMARETVKKRKVDVAKSGEGTSVEGMRAGRSRSSQEETIA